MRICLRSIFPLACPNCNTDNPGTLPSPNFQSSVLVRTQPPPLCLSLGANIACNSSFLPSYHTQFESTIVHDSSFLTHVHVFAGSQVRRLRWSQSQRLPTARKDPATVPEHDCCSPIPPFSRLIRQHGPPVGKHTPRQLQSRGPPCGNPVSCGTPSTHSGEQAEVCRPQNRSARTRLTSEFRRKTCCSLRSQQSTPRGTGTVGRLQPRRPSTLQPRRRG